jgi:HSP20 family molecular chaperone IbpA
MDYLFQLVLEPVDEPRCLNGETSESMSRYQQLLEAEVVELENEVIVTVNLIPGADNCEYSCGLIDKKTLKISCNRKEEKTVAQEGYSMTEQRLCSLHREIPLPAIVTLKGAKSTLRNGILDIHFRKAARKTKKIPE